MSPVKFFSQCPDRTKMHRVYQRLLREVNDNHKYLRCPDLRYNNLEVFHVAIVLDKADLVCAVKEKSIIYDAGFITYSKIIYFAVICSDNSAYIINQSQVF